MSIIAGSDTSATALSHIFYFLFRRPECLQRLYAEVDEAFPQGEDTMDFTKQAEMPYLNACMLSRQFIRLSRPADLTSHYSNEALRLYPPVIMGLQRRVELGGGEKMSPCCWESIVQ